MDSELVFLLAITESGGSIGMECISFEARLFGFTPQLYQCLLCDLGEVAYPLCASVSSAVE